MMRINACAQHATRMWWALRKDNVSERIEKQKVAGLDWETARFSNQTATQIVNLFVLLICSAKGLVLRECNACYLPE